MVRFEHSILKENGIDWVLVNHWGISVGSGDFNQSLGCNDANFRLVTDVFKRSGLEDCGEEYARATPKKGQEEEKAHEVFTRLKQHFINQKYREFLRRQGMDFHSVYAGEWSVYSVKIDSDKYYIGDAMDDLFQPLGLFRQGSCYTFLSSCLEAEDCRRRYRTALEYIMFNVEDWIPPLRKGRDAIIREANDIISGMTGDLYCEDTGGQWTSHCEEVPVSDIKANGQRDYSFICAASPNAWICAEPVRSDASPGICATRDEKPDDRRKKWTPPPAPKPAEKPTLSSETLSESPYSPSKPWLKYV